MKLKSSWCHFSWCPRAPTTPFNPSRSAFRWFHLPFCSGNFIAPLERAGDTRVVRNSRGQVIPLNRDSTKIALNSITLVQTAENSKMVYTSTANANPVLSFACPNPVAQTFPVIFFRRMQIIPLNCILKYFLSFNKIS